MVKEKQRLDPRVFKVPIDRIRKGYYSDKYFTRLVEVLEKDKRHPIVLYQIFPRKDAVVVGIDEALAILKYGTGYYSDKEKSAELYSRLDIVERKLQRAAYDADEEMLTKMYMEKWQLRHRLNEIWVNKWDELDVKALYDGERIRKGEPIMTIEGDPSFFGYLETILIGVIARGSSTATAVSRVVSVANSKPILFFSARFDHYWVQATDGYAALKAGAFGVSTDANADYWGAESLGTVPHALIACYDGSTADASIAFDKHMSSHINRIILVDWDNDVVGTTKTVIKRFYQHITGKSFIEGKTDPSSIIGPGKGKIWGVRFDTAGDMRDRFVVPRDKSSFGVCPELVWRARKEFNRIGLKDLKIVVSGGFDAERIDLFEKLNVPVDVYGVGSYLLREKIDITADIVEVNGKPCAKVGRKKGDLSRLVPVEGF